MAAFIRFHPDQTHTRPRPRWPGTLQRLQAAAPHQPGVSTCLAHTLAPSLASSLAPSLAPRGAILSGQNLLINMFIDTTSLLSFCLYTWTYLCMYIIIVNITHQSKYVLISPSPATQTDGVLEREHKHLVSSLGFGVVCNLSLSLSLHSLHPIGSV